MTGLDALRIIRQETDLPVILITGRSEDAYKVLGLEYADDYLVKPFTMPEMLSRIRAVMRGFTRGRLERPPLKRAISALTSMPVWSPWLGG